MACARGCAAVAAGRPAHVAFQGPTAGARRRAPQPAERPQGDRRADDAARTRAPPAGADDPARRLPARGALAPDRLG
eukprot:CAMPEP_0119529694 /NCGR_PEP_ID=MMETSP1344-20130328/43655_1 /TAXON_ID=236787 /ORGANISM="Florenciella parvula, Strain CCMP2471" /LENGTH=76 /DNA_ID=CAMNT_0007569389 /DNA_START=89 /DNA_END=316 /DNA_ORIENTATION=+